MKLLVKKLHDDAILPFKSRETDEGFDLFALEDTLLPLNRSVVVKTGISAAVDTGKHWLQIQERSGLAAKGIKIGAGIVDIGYTGPVNVVLFNFTGSDYVVKKGDKIAQMVIREHFTATVEEINDLMPSDRGSAGFGSSGR